MDILSLEPSRSLYNKVRGGFIAQGFSLSRWCDSHGLNVQNAQSCLIGTWNGPKAKELRAELVRASGISKPFLLDTEAEPHQHNAVAEG
jgi:hypothetical protein